MLFTKENMKDYSEDIEKMAYGNMLKKRQFDKIKKETIKNMFWLKKYLQQQKSAKDLVQQDGLLPLYLPTNTRR